MSPMPRLGRKTSTLILTLLVLLAASLTVFSPALAQENETDGGNETPAANETPDGNATQGGATDGGDGAAPGEGAVRKYTVRSQETGCPEGEDPCWDIPVFPVLAGDQVELTVDLTSGFHDLTFRDPLADVATPSPSSEVHVLTFTVPDNFQRLDFVCTIHPTTMTGSFLPPDQLGAATEGEEVVEMGVHFLAYWVGVIAFAILFVVYGITFFLFKYNETPATTDHMDRSSSEGGKRMEARTAVIFAVVIAAVAIALIVWSIQRNAHTG